MRFAQHLLTMVVVAFPVAANAQHMVGGHGISGGMQPQQMMHQQMVMRQQMLYQQQMMRQQMLYEQQMARQQMLREQQMMQQMQSQFDLAGGMNQPFFSYGFQEPDVTVAGSHVRVVNPTENSAVVELRPKGRRKKSGFRVPARGSREVNVQNGLYQVFFRFSDEPDALYQGDNIRLSNQIAEIRLEATPNGNYGLRRVE